MVCSYEKVPGIVGLAVPPIRAKVKAEHGLRNPSVSMMVALPTDKQNRFPQGKFPRRHQTHELPSFYILKMCSRIPIADYIHTQNFKLKF